MSNVDPVKVQSSLATSLSAIFSGAQSVGHLNDGTAVEFMPAKMKSLRVLVQLFETAIKTLTPEDLETIILLIAGKQKAAMAAGGSPLEADVNETVDILQQAFSNTQVLAHVFMALLDILPQAVPLFTSLSGEAFEELNADEGILIVIGIIGVNYSFFTQSLLPALSVLLRSQVMEQAKTNPTISNALKRRSGKKG